MSAAVTGTDPDGFEEYGVGESEVAPVHSNWLRGLDNQSAPPSAPDDDVEQNQFWDTPPRYSATNLTSLAPGPLTRARSGWRTRSARLLFTTIFLAVIALLVLEMKSLSARVLLTSTRAFSVLLSSQPGSTSRRLASPARVERLE